MARVRIDRQRLIRLLDGYPVQVPTSVGLLEMEGVQLPWTPMEHLVPTPPHIREARKRLGLAHGIQVWANDIYECWVTTAPGESEEMKWLSIKRYDRAPTHNWRHLQQIKNEVLGPEWEAVELYPAESRLADNANQTHLWAIPGRLPLGFPEGLVAYDDAAEAWTKDPTHRGRQEPRQPGLTVGDTMLEAQEKSGITQKTVVDMYQKESQGGEE